MGRLRFFAVADGSELRPPAAVATLGAGALGEGWSMVVDEGRGIVRVGGLGANGEMALYSVAL